MNQHCLGSCSQNTDQQAGSCAMQSSQVCSEPAPQDSKCGPHATGAQLAHTGEPQTGCTTHHAVQDPQWLGPSEMPTPQAAAATEITMCKPHTDL